MKRLKDKIAVITGASSGIGRGIAEAFAKEDADIVVNYRKSKEKAESLVEEIKQTGRRAIAVQADMGNEGDIDRLITETIEEFVEAEKFRGIEAETEAATQEESTIEGETVLDEEEIVEEETIEDFVETEKLRSAEKDELIESNNTTLIE